MSLMLALLSINVVAVALGVGLTVGVLAWDWRANANRCLALGLGLIATHQGLVLLAAWSGSADRQWTLALLSLAATAAFAPAWFAFSLAIAKAQNGAKKSWWSLVLAALVLLMAGGWIGLALGRVVRPIQLPGIPVALLGLDAWGTLYFTCHLVAIGLLLVHLENLYRRAAPTDRGRIAPLIVGCFVFFGWQIVGASHTLLYAVMHPLLPWLSGVAFLVSGSLIAFALVRHRLLQVNLYVSRYVVYRSLTLALISGYLISLAVAAQVFRKLEIPIDLLSGTLLAILGGAVLALLLLSEKLRWRAKRFIQEHFYVRKYDYQAEWIEFTNSLSQATTESDIAERILQRLRTAMGVEETAIYVARGDGLELLHRLGFADLPTTLTAAAGPDAAPAGSASSPTNGSAVPGELQVHLVTGRVARVVAMQSIHGLMGLFLVGTARSGKTFVMDDQHLLDAVAAQTGTALLNARLAREASEGQAFHAVARMSTFVAHDLKNSASALTMLAKNAEQFVGDPEFQRDLVRNLQQIAGKIGRLLSTLTSPERVPTAPRRLNLCRSAEAWVRELLPQLPMRIQVKLELGATGDNLADPEQMRSVLHNLVMNAVEATPGEGTIEVSTRQEGERSVLAVADTGRGMSREFTRTRLFQPFQTTKARGLGIGLYQCRQIIHAAGGSLTVESEEGKGSRFVVSLPCQAEPAGTGQVRGQESEGEEQKRPAGSQEHKDIACTRSQGLADPEGGNGGTRHMP